MTIDEMLTEGLFLMLTGMGFVVVFLTVLVMLLNLMHKLLPEQEIATQELSPTSGHKHDNRSLTAVLTAAVHQHRVTNKMTE